uniref:Uncharacterized protein n=1 Tax=Opuntia streptacantha TaxID=393608 RepID=A0A7C9CN40_OPUST
MYKNSVFAVHLCLFNSQQDFIHLNTPPDHSIWVCLANLRPFYDRCYFGLALFWSPRFKFWSICGPKTGSLITFLQHMIDTPGKSLAGFNLGQANCTYVKIDRPV